MSILRYRPKRIVCDGGGCSAVVAFLPRQWKVLAAKDRGAWHLCPSCQEREGKRELGEVLGFVCAECGSEFESRGSLVLHKGWHTRWSNVA